MNNKSIGKYRSNKKFFISHNHVIVLLVVHGDLRKMELADELPKKQISLISTDSVEVSIGESKNIYARP